MAHIASEGLFIFLLDGEEGIDALSWFLTALELSSKLVTKFFKGIDGIRLEPGILGFSSALDSDREGLA